MSSETINALNVYDQNYKFYVFCAKEHLSYTNLAFSVDINILELNRFFSNKVSK